MKAMAEREQLEQAINTLEAQRAILGDAVVDTMIAAARKELAALERTEASRPALEGERKLVTVMFADISGFTALAETMDPEAVRDLMNTCFEQLVPVIQKYEGTVDKFIGDGVMVLFGAPLAHENDPERALRAALEMMGALAAFNAQHRTDLDIHFGVNTGLVIAGGIGTRERQEYSVMGDAVNLAARLEDASEPGEILVGPDTHRLTAPLFDFETLPPIRVKGRSELLVVYRLLGLRAAPSSVRGIEGLSSPLVGRGSELLQLQTALRVLQEGRGGKVAIVGEAGLGKSRLVAEVRQSLNGNLAWVEGRCLAHTQGMGYWVARDVLCGLLGVNADTPAATLGGALYHSVAQLFPEHEADSYPYLALVLGIPLDALDTTMTERVKYLEAATLQRRIHEAFREYVRRQAMEQPLVLVWEDLHWADPSSLHLLEALLSLTDQAPLLLLLALRLGGGRVEPFHLRATTTYGQRYQVIELEPLTHDDGTQLVHNLLKIEDLPEETRELILDRAGGNPFYIEELLRSLIDAGVVILRGDRAIATHAISELDVPDTLQGVIMARIDRLMPRVKRTLQTAAVIGRVFQRRVLAYLLDPETANGRLDTTLEELRGHEFIRVRVADTWDGVEEQEYIFKHTLTQETAYHSLLITQRKGLHKQAGEAYEALFADRRDELMPTLGYHFEKAEVNDKAFRYFAQAGERAKATYANEEAIRYFRTALEVAEEVTEDISEEKSTIHEHLGDILVNIGQYDKALESYTAAFDLLEELPLLSSVSERVAALHRKAGMVYERKGEYGMALEWLSEAEERLDDKRSAEMARISTSMAGVLYRQGEGAEAMEWCQRGLEIAQRIDERGELAHAYMLRGVLNGSLGNPSQAISDCLRSLHLCQDIGDLSQQARAHNNLGLHYYYEGDWEQAAAHYSQSLEIRERIGDVNGWATVSNNLGELYLNQGRFDEAAECFRRCLETWERTGYLLGVALSYRNLGQVYARREEWDTALEHLGMSLHKLEEIGSRDWLMAEVYRHFAEVYLGLGQWETACGFGQRSLDIAVAQEIKLVEGGARRVLGQLHRCRGKWDEAEALLRESLRLSEEQAQRYEAGQVLWELALLYLDRARSGGNGRERAKMAEALDRSIAIFGELGAQWDLARALKGKACQVKTGD